MEYTFASYSFLAAVAFVSGLTRGFAGFGSALIFMPLCGVLIGSQVAASLLLVMDFVLTAPMVVKAWPQAQKRDVSIIWIGALIAIPIGIAVLVYSDPITVRWLIIALIA